VEVELGFLDDVEADIGSAITLYEARVELGEHAIRRGTDLRTVIDQVASPDVRALLEAHVAPGADRPVSERRYRDAVGRGRRDLRARLADVFHRHGVDVLLAPTTPLPAAPLGTGAGARAKAVGTVELDGRTVPTFETYIHHTGPMATAGLPGVTLPGGTAGDLPVGLALDALPGADRVLLAVALLVEEVIGA
jgi:mandelamide amidase